MPSSASHQFQLLYLQFTITLFAPSSQTELLYNCSITHWLRNLGHQGTILDLIWWNLVVVQSLSILFSARILYIYDKCEWLRDHLSWRNVNRLRSATLIINSVCPPRRRRCPPLGHKININKSLVNEIPALCHTQTMIRHLGRLMIVQQQLNGVCVCVCVCMSVCIKSALQCSCENFSASSFQ